MLRESRHFGLRTMSSMSSPQSKHATPLLIDVTQGVSAMNIQSNSSSSAERARNKDKGKLRTAGVKERHGSGAVVCDGDGDEKSASSDSSWDKIDIYPGKGVKVSSGASSRLHRSTSAAAHHRSTPSKSPREVPATAVSPSVTSSRTRSSTRSSGDDHRYPPRSLDSGEQLGQPAPAMTSSRGALPAAVPRKVEDAAHTKTTRTTSESPRDTTGSPSIAASTTSSATSNNSRTRTKSSGSRQSKLKASAARSKPQKSFETDPSSPSASSVFSPSFSEYSVIPPSFVIEGEIEAMGVEEDIRFFEAREAQLKAELEDVWNKLAELRTLFEITQDDIDEIMGKPAQAATGASREREDEEMTDAGDEDARSDTTERLEDESQVEPPPASFDDASPRIPSSVKGKQRASSVVTDRTQSPPTVAASASAPKSESALTTKLGRAKTMPITSANEVATNPFYAAPPPSSLDDMIIPVLEPDSYLIFLDLETNDAACAMSEIIILEIAIRVVDKNFTPVDDGLSLLVHWDQSAQEIKEILPPVVKEMHTKSGLLDAYARTPPQDRLRLPQAERRVCEYLRRNRIQWGKGIMAGAGITFDRAVVRAHMPNLDKYFHRQIFDTTTLWHLVKRRYNRTTRFSTVCMHRAMDDINGSIREAHTYANLILKPPKEVRWPSNGI